MTTRAQPWYGGTPSLLVDARGETRQAIGGTVALE